MKWCNTERGEDKCGCWVCACGHSLKRHIVLGEGCVDCMFVQTSNVCEGFEFSHNDLCSLECMFYKKVLEAKNKA